jgi:tetraacyldisaccharide 4'-kinase
MTARRPWARPLVPLYTAALRIKDSLRTQPKRLQHPVISIGSLSAGGAGKTPIVIALASLLKEHGWQVDVLSRGYGRDNTRTAAVDLNAPTPARTFGDEPTLIAQRTNAPVFVGASRYAAGTLAESTSTPTLHLLDDGFQHRQLARTLDLVLITADDLADTLIPAGNLREPLTALARADVVVVREDEADVVAKRVWPLLRERAQLWIVRRRLQFPAPLFVFGAGLKPIAFCALARPEAFAANLAEAGCGIVETVAFPDHHRYTLADIDRILAVARSLNATGFVTTEKDAVKLTPTLRSRLEQLGPLMVVALEAEFGDPAAVLAFLEAAITQPEAAR